MSDSLQPHGFYSPPASSVHGISQTRIPEWVAMPSSKGSSQPRDGTCISCISYFGRRVLYHYCHPFIDCLLYTRHGEQEGSRNSLRPCPPAVCIRVWGILFTLAFIECLLYIYQASFQVKGEHRGKQTKIHGTHILVVVSLGARRY